jgi:hypothetical protein
MEILCWWNAEKLAAVQVVRVSSGSESSISWAQLLISPSMCGLIAPKTSMTAGRKTMSFAWQGASYLVRLPPQRFSAAPNVLFFYWWR